MSKDDIMGGEFDWYDLRKESFTHDKPVEAFESQQSTAASSCQRSSLATARPSCSSSSNEIGESTWIRDEDNREEVASSFSGLGLYSSQLVHPTKARAKAPRTHRPRKNRLNNARKQNKTEKTIGVKATRPSFRGKTPLGDTRQAGPRRPNTIRDSSRESTSASCTKDQVTNLVARFEKI